MACSNTARASIPALPQAEWPWACYFLSLWVSTILSVNWNNTFTWEVVVKPGPASWACNAQLNRVLGSEGPSVWFNAFLLYMEICNTFVFELVFCKWTLMGQWSVHVSRWDTYMWYVYLPLLLPLRIVFAIPHEHRIPVVMEFHDAWEFREPRSEHKIRMLHLRLNKWVLRRHFPFEPEHLLWMQK